MVLAMVRAINQVYKGPYEFQIEITHRNYLKFWRSAPNPEQRKETDFSGVGFTQRKPYFENVNMSGRLDTHTISIWQFKKWKNWLFDAMRPFILLQQRGYLDTTFRTMEMVLLCP